MNKKLARTNMRMGITLFIVVLFMIGITFLWAALYSHYVSGAA